MRIAEDESRVRALAGDAEAGTEPGIEPTVGGGGMGLLVVQFLSNSSAVSPVHR